MDRDEFHIKQMDPNELENRMARNKRKTTPIISRLDQTNKNNTSRQKKLGKALTIKTKKQNFKKNL